MAQQQTPQGSTSNRDSQQVAAGKGSSVGTPSTQRDQKQEFGSQAGSTQRPMGSQSKTDLDEDDDSLEPVEHYRKGDDEANADIERPSDSSTSTTRKINR